MTSGERSVRMFNEISNIIWGDIPTDDKPISELVIETNKKNIEEAIKEERERCAKIAESKIIKDPDDVNAMTHFIEEIYKSKCHAINFTCEQISKAIREQG